MTESASNADALCERDFIRVRKIVYSELGIQLNDEKRTMLEGRLRKRVRALNLASFADYCVYLFSSQGQREEIPFLLDVVTTNKTDFFRESRHFDYLTSTALPLVHRANSDPRGPLLWSAGCSTGEEPYTLAIVLQEFAEQHPGFQFRLLATDISNAVLAKARQAVYTADAVKPIPTSLLRKYLLRGRDPDHPRFRVVPELRGLVNFRRLNFMDDDFGVPEPMDIIFCRNVLIYFERAIQLRLITRFVQLLRPGGYLFLGHSESINGFDLPLRLMGPTVYRKTEEDRLSRDPKPRVA